MLVVLSKPVTYQDVTFDKIVISPLNKIGPKTISLVQITPVVQSVRLQEKVSENADFKSGSDFHRAASWRAWFLQGEFV